jgi:hypothetical protein
LATITTDTSYYTLMVEELATTGARAPARRARVSPFPRWNRPKYVEICEAWLVQGWLPCHRGAWLPGPSPARAELPAQPEHRDGTSNRPQPGAGDDPRNCRAFCCNPTRVRLRSARPAGGLRCRRLPPLRQDQRAAGSRRPEPRGVGAHIFRQLRLLGSNR